MPKTRKKKPAAVSDENTAPAAPAKPKTRRKAKPSEETFPADPPAPKVPANRFGITAKTTTWDRADEVLDTITSVRTIFPGFNHAIRCGGLPTRRVTVVHGPTHGGKTAFILGLIKSFVDGGHLAGYVDAEHATGSTFAASIIGELSTFPNFVATRPKSYEETIAKVDAFLHQARELRKKHEDFRSIIVVDSINKLVPERELSKLLASGEDKRVKDASAAGEMTKGHHARYRAAVNQAWLDHLTPKIASADCAFVVIAQERDDQDADGFGDDFKVKGGAALLYDSSVVARVFKSSPLLVKSSEKASNENIAGFKHRIRVWKSKVGHMDGRYTDSFIYISNGKVTPPGLDIARDAVAMAEEFGIVVKNGSWYSWKPPSGGASRRKQGENAFVIYFANNPDRLNELLSQVNEEIDKRATT